jgi:hypothetical protein
MLLQAMGELRSDDLLWCDGWQRWISASAVAPVTTRDRRRVGEPECQSALALLACCVHHTIADNPGDREQPSNRTRMT